MTSFDLIFKITTQKDYIVHLVCTPPPEVDSVVEESEDGEEIESATTGAPNIEARTPLKT